LTPRGRSADVTFSAPDGVSVPGTLCVAEKSRTVAILLHGITTDRNEYLDFYRTLADHLASNGVSSLRFDFRGHGSSKEPQTGFSPIGQVLDLMGAVNFLNQKFGSSTHRQIVFGTSFGAAPGIFLSKMVPATFEKVYLLAPVLDYRMTFLEPRTAWAKEYFTTQAIADARLKGYLLLDQFKVGVRALAEMELLSPTETATKLKQTQIRIVHGRTDSMVPVEQSLVLRDLGGHVSMMEIDNMDHGYNAVGDEEGTGPQSLQNRQRIFDDFLHFLGDGNAAH
jgi:alpha/beta superfamily hydrolase